MTILVSHDPLTLVVELARVLWPELCATVHWSDDTSGLLDEEETAELIARLDEEDAAAFAELRAEVEAEGRDPDEDLRIMPPVVPILPLGRGALVEVHVWTGQTIDEGIQALAHVLAEVEAWRTRREGDEAHIDTLREALLTAYRERVVGASMAALTAAATAHAGGVGGRD